MENSSTEVKVFSTDDKDFEKILTQLGAKANDQSAGIFLPSAQFAVTQVDNGFAVTKKDNKTAENKPEIKFSIVQRDHSIEAIEALRKDFSAALESIKTELSALKPTPANNAAPPMTEEEKKKLEEEKKMKEAPCAAPPAGSDPYPKVPSPKDGKCPAGYKLSEDGKACVPVKAEMGAEPMRIPRKENYNPVLTKAFGEEADHSSIHSKGAEMIVKRFKRKVVE